MPIMQKVKLDQATIDWKNAVLSDDINLANKIFMGVLYADFNHIIYNSARERFNSEIIDFGIDSDEIVNDCYMRLLKRVKEKDSLDLRYGFNSLISYSKSLIFNTIRDIQNKNPKGHFCQTRTVSFEADEANESNLDELDNERDKSPLLKITRYEDMKSSDVEGSFLDRVIDKSGPLSNPEDLAIVHNILNIILNKYSKEDIRILFDSELGSIVNYKKDTELYNAIKQKKSRMLKEIRTLLGE